MNTEDVKRLLALWPGSQRELERRTGVPQSKLSRIKAGKLGASPEVEAKIRKAFADLRTKINQALD